MVKCEICNEEIGLDSHGCPVYCGDHLIKLDDCGCK